VSKPDDLRNESHDITTNKPLNMRSWQDVREVVDKGVEEARRNDRAEQSRK
jgi:hypothetical protein